MTPQEYWGGEGVRFLNEDGTLPTVEERVKEGFRRGAEEGFWDGIETMRLHQAEADKLQLDEALALVGKKLREMSK